MPSSNKPPRYTYIQVADKYFCAQCSLTTLIWLFLVRFKSLHLHSLGLQQRQLPQILKSIRDHRKHPARHISSTASSTTPNTIDLPVFAHLCMPVHNGYKAFNFNDLTATKIFSASIDETTVAQEIKCVNEAASLSFTPALITSDLEGRWYTESFIPGNRSSKKQQSQPATLYRNTIVDHLSEMILSKPHHVTDLNAYSDKICKLLRIQLDKMKANEIDTSNISAFISGISSQMKRCDNVKIHCGFTHGDFSFVNFLYSDNNIVVIDWESSKNRSILNDLYNYFFTELYYARTSSNSLQDMNDAILLLENRLAQKNNEFNNSLTPIREVYRWLYYLERMETLISRELTPNCLNVIQHSIEIFDEYESIAADCTRI